MCLFFFLFDLLPLTAANILLSLQIKVNHDVSKLGGEEFAVTYVGIRSWREECSAD